LTKKEDGVRNSDAVVIMKSDSQVHALTPGFLPLRLVTYLILFGVIVLWMGYPSFVHPLFVGYSILTLATVGLVAFKRWQQFLVSRLVVNCLHLCAEIAVASAVIYTSGNVQSQFSALYIVTIVSAALTFRLVGTITVASLVSVAYLVVIWLGLSAPDADLTLASLQTIFTTGDSVFLYAVLLHLLIFYLVAAISGYLAERLRRHKTELEETSQALRRARLETDDILQHLNSGLLTIDSAGKIIYFNRAAERILGYKEEDVRGLTCDEAFAERIPELAICLNDGILWRDGHPRREFEAMTCEGVRFPIGISTSVLTEGDGELRGVIAIFSDLTDAKLLDAKVRAADRLAAIGELSASIAHEIRNPLAAISGSVEVLAKELKLESQNERLMQLIIKESQRLNKILRDFLSYARIERPTYAKVDVCHVASDVIQLLANHEGFNSNVTLNLHSDEPVCYVAGDEDLMRQLLFNIAKNACEAFDGRNGAVQFHIHKSGHSSDVSVTVSDDGPGISTEHLKKVFQPFFSTKKQGTGLGLAIVHRVATALQASVTVDSEIGRGTRFTLIFKSIVTEGTHVESIPSVMTSV
jgi:two-component system, NtrC family, sensor histidine kinase PilS